MSQQLRLALLQMDIAFGEPDVNRARAADLIAEAAANGADLVVLPEMWNTGYSLDNIQEIADHDGQETIALMSELAQAYNLNIHAGSVASLVDGKVYNSTYVFNRAGEIVGRYSKIHLFRLMDEEKYLEAGNEIGLFELEGVQVGTMICYDLRFPELTRTMSLNGAQIVFLPAEWPHPRLNHWRHLQLARAIENQMFVVSTNRVGTAGETAFFGHSMVVDPWGEVLVEGEETEQILYATVDLSVVPEIRSRIPIFEDRRPDLYTKR
ncbi:carbon-nitrogen family hydrolase [Tumebacillus permanentifrigoris]|uniref:Putative amidohydrolase n=1 Tax=Tumebacillus permanentifrigoris TaxID=378543 RepID=A0A316DEJ3_9BACL|nr:carbon-nitrogen family hydrolase [Tumebacillus permanentifrigoris]PWK15982.1 putative amidohydrolase [Tumebacillus permanentifrigoris]